MIKFDKVSYNLFHKKDLYTDVSFTIEEGQHCAFIGASGSGKSHAYRYNNEILKNTYLTETLKWSQA